MKRRRFILGLGAATAGGSAMLGSGAFTSVEAERSVTIDVVGDADAFLRLAPCEDSPNGAYVTGAADGAMAVDLSESNEAVSGKGVNQESFYVFHDVFEIGNQGTQPVCVDFEVDVPAIPGPVPDRYDFVQGDPAVVFYRGDNPDERITVGELDPGRDGAISLRPGDSQCVGFEVRALGFDSGEDLFNGANLTIHAAADANCEVSTVDPSRQPDDIDGLAAWFDATTLDVSGGNAIASWPDQTANANDVMARGSPTFDADAFGAGGVRFDGDDAFVAEEPTGLNLTDEMTVFTVFTADSNLSDNIGVLHGKQGGAAHNDRNWWHSLDNGQGYAGGDGQLGFRTSSNGDVDFTLVAEGNYIDDTAYLSAVRMSAEDDIAELRVNGAREDRKISGIGRPDAKNQSLYIGAQNDPGTDDLHRYFEGVIAEIIVYDRLLTPAERADVEQSLQTKYNL
ncbi:LamG-like jellyroll fold domain-containing protein [Halorhabdus amylolytica]|uniref:LamG-like jellyroll fold domain-containing protein n=1 Tax=Halorhabdus amylolytica TaxID=2559573 RepID=UPI00145A3FB9|nr:LamG-like jellyroll fold domain-containing protein [Halorhabdus amylolytica]